ncbi:MAG TPA: orotate phosphoribosyltransferase [Candidatus Dormibacteraeota bacterium]|nr:orotate phosphoribosyltransferase [Candidatus Dormibacteraeota bacterium]
MSAVGRLDLSMERRLVADRTDKQLRALELFSQSGAFLEGHFVYTSGRHGRQYLEKFRLLERAEYTEPLCRMIAATFENSGAQVVAAPTTGGIIMAYEVGRILGVPGIFCERSEAGRVFRRGFKIEQGQKVLVVDDIVTTGGSLKDTFDAVQKLGGEIVGVGVLADRSGSKVDVPYPYFACLEVGFETWTAEDCPLCAAGDRPEGHRGSSPSADPLT